MLLFRPAEGSFFWFCSKKINAGCTIEFQLDRDGKTDNVFFCGGEDVDGSFGFMAIATIGQPRRVRLGDDRKKVPSTQSESARSTEPLRGAGKRNPSVRPTCRPGKRKRTAKTAPTADLIGAER